MGEEEGRTPPVTTEPVGHTGTAYSKLALLLETISITKGKILQRPVVSLAPPSLTTLVLCPLTCWDIMGPIPGVTLLKY